MLLLFVPVARLTYIQRRLAPTAAPKADFEDSAATVDVVGGRPSARQLLVNGTGITKLTIDTKLLAYIPKALRPNASSMLNICFGMGTTYRSSIILGLHTDAGELDPTVPSLMSCSTRMRTATCTARSATSPSTTVVTMSAYPISATT